MSPNPFLNPSFDGKPVALFLSDIHLGAWYNFHQQLIEFLQAINSSAYDSVLSDLKVLIITGDFLDVLMSSADILTNKDNKAMQIYQELNNLQTNRGIEIIYILGNHEIGYPKDFNAAKAEFINDFQAAGLSGKLNFFNSNNICQFLIWKSASNGAVTLQLHDSIKSIEKSSGFREIVLGPVVSSAGSDNEIFIAHGHQFSKCFSKLSAFLFWDPLLEAPENIKEALDFIWNFLPEGPDYNDLISAVDEWGKSLNKSPQEIQEIKDWLNSHKAFVKLFLKAFKKKTKHYWLLSLIKWNVNKGVVKLVKKLNKKGRKIKEVIFGHTHEVWEESKKGIMIYNIGAWQFANGATYTEEDADRSIHLHTINIS